MGLERTYRRARRRVRCVTRGHRWRQADRLHGELIVSAEQCIRCGRVKEHAVRPATPSHT